MAGIINNSAINIMVTPYMMSTDSMATDAMATDVMVTVSMVNVTNNKPMPIGQVIVFGLLAAATILLTITGNLIVLLSFIVERSIRQPTNYFIASLAVSDLLIGLISMPLYTVYLLAGKHWPLGVFVCDLWLSIDYTLCLCSIYTVCCITVDRFCSVKIPARYRHWRTERKVLLIIAVVWVVPIAVFFTTIFGWQYFVGIRTVAPGMCYVQYMDSQVFNAVLQVGYFWVTLIAMCTLYAGIYSVALELQQKSEKKKNQKATRLDSKASLVRHSTLDARGTRVGVGPSNGDMTYVLVSSRTGDADLGAGGTKDPGLQGSGNGRDGERSSTGGFSSDSDPSSSKPNGDRKSGPNRPNLPLKSIPCSVEKCDVTRAASTHDLMTMTKLDHETDDVTMTRAISAQNIAVCPQLKQHDDVVAMTSAQTTCEDGGAACSSALGFLCDTIAEDFPVLNEYKRKKIEDIRTGDTPASSVPSGEALNCIVENFCLSEIHCRDRCGFSEECRCLDPSRPSSPIWVYRPSVERKLDWEGTAGHGVLTEGQNRLPCDGKACGGKETCALLNNKFSCDLDVEERDMERMETEERRPVDHYQHHHQEDHGVDDGKARRGDTDQKSFDERLLGTMARWYHRCRDRLRRACGGTRPHCKKSKKEDRARKALRTITIILGAFVLCWTPWHVLSMIMGFCDNCVLDVLYDISYWLCYLNSPINPFCYAFANQQLKKTFVRVVRLDWHKS